jgi:hypothetical protein
LLVGRRVEAHVGTLSARLKGAEVREASRHRIGAQGPHGGRRAL